MVQAEKPTRWSLLDLLPEPVEKSLEDQLAQLEERVSQFEGMREALTSQVSAADFKKALSLQEDITTIKSRLSTYTWLHFCEDSQNPEALSLRDRVDEVLTDAGNRCLYFDLWFMDLPDDTAAKLIAQGGELRYFLETIRKFRPFKLSEPEEKIINSKDVNGIDAVVNLYEMVVNNMAFKLNVDGEEKSLTRDELTTYVHHPSADVRAAAYKELFRIYEQNATVLAQMYVHRARDWHAEGIEMRGYASAIAARNLENDLPDNVVETLLAVCRKNAPLFQRYFRLKARLLGMKKLRRYDLYAPLAQADKRFDFETGTRMVLDSYGAFSPDVAALVKRVYDQNHIDAEVRSGKRGGAFCYTAMPRLTPWVLINYNGQARDVATLAHELGHAIHGMLADDHSILVQEPSIPLAETASVFGEMLLTDRLLKQEQDNSVRRELLSTALDEAYATVIRQAYFTIFEKDAHEMIVSGETLDALSERYLENLREQFGDAVDVSEDFRLEWIGVPHMYNVPFYTYGYSFGQLLVLALYQQYQLNPKTFLPKYLRILSYGGSEAPLTVLNEAELDVTQPAFWQGGFDVLDKMIAELEQIA